MTSSIADDLLAELVTDGTPERLLVYADALQTRGDVRGELIVLDVHAQTTNTPRNARADEIETKLSAELIAELGTTSGVRLRWKHGFVHEVTIEGKLIPQVADRRWLEHEALALLRSFGIPAASKDEREAYPIELIAASQVARTLESIKLGGTSCALPAEDQIAKLLGALPRLREVELCAKDMPTDAVLVRLAAVEQLERLALWTPGDVELLARLIAAPWSRLRGLTVMTVWAIGVDRPQELLAVLRPLLDGTRLPDLDELAIMRCGYEEELISELPRRPLGRRLRKLGFDWHCVQPEALERVCAEFAEIELVWPRPLGNELNAADEHQFVRRLRAGLDRDREGLVHAMRAAELDDDASHWLEVGYANGALERLPEKLDAMDRAVACKPGCAAGWAGRGSALRDMGRLEEAIASYKQALVQGRYDASIRYGFGLTLARANRLDDAIVEFEELGRLRDVIEILIEQERIDEAVERYRPMQFASPKDPYVLGFGSYLMSMTSRPIGALAHAPEPTSPMSEAQYSQLFARASALRELRRYSEADALYQRIVDGSTSAAWIAVAWLGQATLDARDCFAAFEDSEPQELADTISAHINTRRDPSQPMVRTPRADDRIHAAVCGVAAAAMVGRYDDTRRVAAAFGAYLDGPAPWKHTHWWLDLACLVRYVAARVDPATARLVRTTYKVATGRMPPSSLLPSQVDVPPTIAARRRRLR